MRGLPILASLAAVALVVGCANPSSTSRPLPPPSRSAPTTTPSTAVVPLRQPVITPDLRPTGRVQMVNTNGHFVVVSFANNFMPSLNDRLAIFRDGSRIGEIKITGPQREYNIVGEILSGDPQVQDQVKPD